MIRAGLRTVALALLAACSGDQATTLAKGNFPWGIAVDANSVYWVNVSGGTVMKVPKGGGTPITLASGQVSPVSIAIDANNVYWTNSGTSMCAPSGACTSNADGKVMSVPLSGGTPTVLASGQLTPVSVAVDGQNVYFIDGGTSVFDSFVADGSVMKVPISGGTPTTLATGLWLPGALAIDTTNVYWTVPDQQGINGKLMSVPIAGGTSTVLASGWPPWLTETGGATVPKIIAADGTNVYWVAGAFNTDGPKIMKVSTSGGATTTIGSVQSQFTTLAIDSANLYWTNGKDFVRLPLAGGAATTFAKGEGSLDPGGIALDSTAVFWTDALMATVMSAPR